MIGQKLMVRMDGTTPTAALLGRIQRGEVGGVILFGANVVSKSQVLALTTKLQAAAKAGGRAEAPDRGRPGRRLDQAHPVGAADALATADRRGRPAGVARTQGTDTATALKALGINVDLAPVADVPGSTSSFMYQAGRTWSFSGSTTARLSDAFATGLRLEGVVPTMKHFPGIGFATKNTDSYVVTITASQDQPGTGPHALPDGDRPPHPADHASNATYTVVRPGQRGGLVARHLARPCSATTGLLGVSRSRTRSTARRRPGASRSGPWPRRPPRPGRT